MFLKLDNVLIRVEYPTCFCPSVLNRDPGTTRMETGSTFSPSSSTVYPSFFGLAVDVRSFRLQ